MQMEYKPEENQLEKLYKGTLEAVLCFRVEEKLPILYMNDAGKTLLDYEGKDVQGEYGNLMHLILPADRMAFYELIGQMQPEDMVETEFRTSKDSDKWIWASILMNEPDSEGNAVCFMLLKNVTGFRQRQIEQEAILRFLPGGVATFLFDEQLTMLKANECFYEYFGEYTNESLPDCKMQVRKWNRVYADERDNLRREVTKQLSQGKQEMKMNYRIKRQDGEIRWLRVYGVFVGQKDGIPLLQCLFLDNTKQEELRLEMNKQNEQYRLALKNSEMIVFNYIPKTDVFICCDTIYHTQEFAIEHFMDVLREGRKVYAQDAELVCRKLHEHDIQDIEIRVDFSQDGHENYKWFRLRGAVVWDEVSQEENITGIMHDITARKNREMKIKESRQEDHLTKLYNAGAVRNLIEDYIAKEYKPYECAYMLIFIENFKIINDRYGHRFGDAILKEISTKLKEVFEENVIIGRIGGIEFGAFIKDTQKEQLAGYAADISEKISRIYIGENEKIHIACTIGITFLQENDSYQAMSERSYKILYHLKKEENICYGFYEDLILNKRENGEYSLSYSSDEVETGEETEDLISYSLGILEKTNDIHNAIHVILRRIGRQFGLNKINIYEVMPKVRAHKVVYEWTETETTSFEGNIEYFTEKEVSVFDESMQSKGFYVMTKKVLDCLKNSELTKHTFMDVQAAMSYAIYDEGVYRGQICFMDCEKERVWTEEELLYYKELSKILASHIIKEKADKASRARGEFLSRMSHEIRTPMNAICGMTELLLQNGLEGVNYEYAQMIKGAAGSLLNIVNDILDFSKIEAGKLEINCANYKIETLLNELIGIVTSKIGNKPLRLYVDINSEVPGELFGDDNRISQIILNLMTNAVKYTEQGYVILHVDCEPTEDANTVLMKFAVEDTGIGIRKEDVEKLFAEFEQVDTKRNRKVEGTGLGLAISKQLAQLMMGKIIVESEYGEGSVFTLVLPQKIVGQVTEKPENADRGVRALVYERDAISEGYLRRVLVALNVPADFAQEREEFREKLETGQYTHVLYDYDKVYDIVKNVLDRYSDTEFVSIISMNQSIPNKIFTKNHYYLQKPMHLYNIRNIFESQAIQAPSTEKIADFRAPSAKILVVDDNLVNLKVAEGLMQTFECEIDMATSGFEAIDKIMEKPEYDILFIDHMMPEMDGVETLRLIRNNCGEYGKNVPAVALTANALKEAEYMFYENGFQDFLAKPIVIHLLREIMQKWIPESKKVHIDIEREDFTKEEKKAFEKWGLDVREGMEHCGNNIKEYRRQLQEMAKEGSERIKQMEISAKERDYSRFESEIHKLSQTAGKIGAKKQMDMVSKYKIAVKNQEFEEIDKQAVKVMNAYRYLFVQIHKLLGSKENGGRDE